MLEKDTLDIRDFSGGMNSNISPYLLPINTAQEIVNFDCSSGALVPLKQDEEIPQQYDIINPKVIYLKDYLLNFSKDTYFVNIHNKIYTNNGYIYKVDANNVLHKIKWDSSLELPHWYVELENNDDAPIGFQIAGYLENGSEKHRSPWKFIGDKPLHSYDDVFKEIITFPKAIDNDMSTYGAYLLRVCKLDPHNYSITDSKTIGVFTQDSTWTKVQKYSDLTNDSSYDDAQEHSDWSVFGGLVTQINEAQYCITLYNEDFNIETVPSDIIPAPSVTNNKLKFISPLPVNWKVRIYKITNDGITDFTLIDTIEYFSTPYEWTDSSESYELAGNHILDSYDNYPIPDMAKFNIVAFAIQFTAVDNKVYFSKQGEPQYFPKTNFFVFDEEITGLGVIQTGLVVFSKNQSWLITGTSAHNFAVYMLSKEQGCLNHESITYLKNQLFWISYDGLCTTTGGQIEIVSKQTLGFFSEQDLDIPNLVSATWNEQIFISGYKNKTLVADFRFGLRFYLLDSPYTWLFIHNGNLLGLQQGNSPYILVKLFHGERNREGYYKSKRFNNDSVLLQRYLKEFRLIADKNSNIHITLTSDDDNVLIENSSISKHKEEFDIIKYMTKQRMYRYLEIEVRSVGNVYEFLFS